MKQGDRNRVPIIKGREWRNRNGRKSLHNHE